MKKTLLYIALAVAATAFATSCVKELVDETTSTENTGKVEVTGQVFEGVMEDTKSVIEGNTPTWVDGDAISIFGSNQEVALECTYLGENKFQSKESTVVEGPYYAIYPHKDGHTVDQATGIFTATVPSEQLIAAGQNVAAGALVSVAASETTELYFRNAVGLVRLENKRNDIVSIKIESTTAGQVIAGEFTMDLNPDKETEDEDPSITLVEGKGATSITLKPAEENGTLATGEYYATLLPCAIDGIKVTFTRKNGETTESVAVTKTVNTTIPRNGGANLGAFFTYEIKNAAELLAWNKANAKWTAWDVVTLTNDIDCADVINSENWEPHAFTGTFDGNGKTINNLVIEKEGPAGFFAQMSGNAFVKNLTFGEGCSFTSVGANAGGRVYAASLVCELKGNAGMDNITNYATIVGNHSGTKSKGNYIAGICASLSGTEVTFTNCKNYGSVTFSATPAVWTCVGGILGESPSKGTTVTNCENYGAILFNGPSNGGNSINLAGIAGGANQVSFDGCSNFGKVEYNAQEAAGGGINIGGIVGHNNSAAIPSLTNCTNGSATDNTLGEIVVSGATSGEIRMGGCVAYIQDVATSISGFKNYGKLTNSVSTASTISMGGVGGRVSNTTNRIASCENKGTITNTGTLMTAYMGGMVGWLNNANTSFDKVSNGGAVTNNGEVTNTLESGATTYIHLGGVVGYAQGGTGHAITNATNTITIKNTKGGDANKIGKCVANLGGIVGKIDQSDLSIGNDVTEGVQNSGAILNEGQSTDNGLGGIVGSITAAANTNTIKNCLNSGKIYRNGWANNIINGHGFGGIVGYHFATGAATLTINTCKNTGSVEKLGGAAYNHHIGGIVGSLFTTTATATISDCVNTGNVTYANGSDWANNRYCYTAGVVGHFNSKGEIVRCSNSGTITNKFATSAATGIRVGGIVGNTMTATITDCKNSGAVKDESTGNGGYIGGIVGWIHTNKGVLTNCDNNGTVSTTFNSETRTTKQNRQHAYIGGIVGGSNVEVVLVNCDNNADIINKSPKSNTGAKTAIAGIAGFCNSHVTMTTCTTSGKIANEGTDTSNEFIGGLAGQIEANKTTKITGCTVNADLTAKVAARNGSNYSGLFVGRLTDKVDGSGDDATLSTTVSGSTVKGGSYNGTPITAENCGTYTFGHGSDYGGQGKTKGKAYATTGITFAE